MYFHSETACKIKKLMMENNKTRSQVLDRKILLDFRFVYLLMRVEKSNQIRGIQCLIELI